MIMYLWFWNSSPILTISSLVLLFCELRVVSVSQSFGLSHRATSSSSLFALRVCQLLGLQGAEFVGFRFVFFFTTQWYITSGAGAAIPTAMCLVIRLGDFKKFAIHAWNDCSSCIFLIPFDHTRVTPKRH